MESWKPFDGKEERKSGRKQQIPRRGRGCMWRGAKGGQTGAQGPGEAMAWGLGSWGHKRPQELTPRVCSFQVRCGGWRCASPRDTASPLDR